MRRLWWKSSFLALLVVPCSALADPSPTPTLPADAKKVLNQLPEKKITMDVVVGAGVRSSDSFREISSLHLQTDVPRLESERAFAPTLSLSLGLQDEQADPTNSVQYSSLKAKSATLSVSKAFSSGTALSVGVEQTQTDFDYPSGAFITTDKVNQTQTQVSLSQSLWQDSFGRASRRLLSQGKASEQALEAQLAVAQDQWLTSIIEVFYQAWLSQASTHVAERSRNLRQRLLSTTRRKLQRGTAERPELLQAQSALLSSQAQLSDRVSTLGDIWRGLVVTLKFPSEWMQVDPRLIPMRLDDPIRSAQKSCGPRGSMNPSPEGVPRLRQLKNEWESTELQVDVAKDGLRPKLALEASATYKGVDTSTPSTAWDETFDQSHPTYALGLNFSTSLEKQGEKAQLKRALAAQMQAKSRYLKEKGDIETDWVNSCLNLHQKVEKVGQLQESFRLQAQRLKLDEERYRLGRLTLQNVIMAADELNQSELAYLQSQVEAHKVAWKVKTLDGSSQRYLQKFLKGWKAVTKDL